MSRDRKNNETSGHDGPPVVGIGASAGGLKALQKFFEHVAEDSGFAYVVIVHLSPSHESRLADVLQPHAAIPVEQVTGDTLLEADHVYVIPPGHDLSAIDTHLRLSGASEKARRRAPIDHFFRTLAATHGDQAVGVILSGSGSDGTLGTRDIHENGGLTIVQDPEEAEHDGMPRSAIASGSVDAVLPIAEIPGALGRAVTTKPRVPETIDDADTEAELQRQIRQIFSLLQSRTGRDFTRYKDSTILRRIARRMQLLGIGRLEDYLGRMNSDEDELTRLADELLITVTHFFRDTEVVDKLREEVIPALFARESDEPLRLWSVGCATGEEVYSLVILMLEEARRRDRPEMGIQFFATDLHEEAVQRAREGLYPLEIEERVSPDLLSRYFVRENDAWRVRRTVREMVVFAVHNVLKDPPFTRMDLISCRNLLIYLRRDTQRELIDLFHHSLNPGGYLVLGTSESVDDHEIFETISKRRALYRRRDAPGRDVRLPVFPFAPAARPGNRQRGEERQTENYETRHRRLLEYYAPPSLLVSPQGTVLHLTRGAGRYLEQPEGRPTSKVLNLVHRNLRAGLRSLLHAAGQGEAQHSLPIEIDTGGETRRVRLHMQPEPAQQGDDRHVLVVFEDMPPEAATDPPAGDRSDTDAAELEAELDRTRSRLDVVIAEYEHSQEDMKASNEELQSMNEELRSTLEELETSKEELQSVNEELQTVNQENRHKVEELSQLSSDLQNLLTATDIATLFLDRELRILRYTPKVTELFRVRSSDRGRPLADLSHRFGDDSITADAQKVLENLIPVEREIADDEGHWYLVRTLPYRSVEDRIEGIVITFVDISDRKRAEEHLQSLTETLEERVTDRTREVDELARQLTEVEQDERRRIAIILHDDVQQLLHALEIRLRMIRSDLADGRTDGLDGLLEGATERLAEAVGIVRTLTVDLTPPVLRSEGLPEALLWLAHQVRDLHGLEVTVQSAPEFELEDEAIRSLAFQTVREVLFNIEKHAGTRRAEVTLEMTDRPTICVRDDGRGFDPRLLNSDSPRKRTGFGLLTLRERLRLVGGSLDIDSKQGEGTLVTLRLPAA